MNAFLFELVVRSLIIACLGLGLRFALTQFSAQARAKVLTLTMIALAILPIAILLLPKVPVTVGKIQVELPTTVLSSEAVAPASTSINLWAIAWLSIMGIFVARVLVSLVRFRKIEQGLCLASEPITVRVKNLTNRAKDVFYSPEGEPPMTWGVVRPKIALPTESETWIEPQFRSVVLHEDAHIRRCDWAVTIGFRFIVALYWFNPCVWLLQAYFEQDSERAADDFVLAQGFDAPEYAERLLDVAKKLRPSAGRLPAVTMARTNRLNGRLRAILSSRTPREPMKGWKKVAVLGSLACGALAGGFILPVIERLPAFDQGSKETNSLEASNTFTTRISNLTNTSFKGSSQSNPDLVSFDEPEIPERPNVSTIYSPDREDSSKPVAKAALATKANATPNPVSQPNPEPHPSPVSTVGEEDGEDNVADNFEPVDLDDDLLEAHYEEARINREARQEQQRAKQDADRVYIEAQRDMADAKREAQREIDRANKEALKEIEKATREIEKSGICISESGKEIKKVNINAKDIALGAAKFGEEIAKNVMGMVSDFGSDGKGTKGQKPKGSSASGKTGSSQKDLKKSKNP